MIDVERELRDLFQSRAANAEPRPDLETVVHDGRPSSSARRLLVAAALVLVAGLLAALFAHTGTATDDRVPTVTFPDRRPPAPQATGAEADVSFYALSIENSTLMLHTPTSHGPLQPTASEAFRAALNDPANVITDSDGTGPAAFYVATCCKPAGTIWRDGKEYDAGTRVDFIASAGSLERATLDPVSGAVRIGFGPINTVVEPGAIDVAVLRTDVAAALIGGANPHVAIDGGGPRRQFALPASLTPCAVAALGDRLVVLVGSLDQTRRCVGDRAIVVDSNNGTVLSSILLPTTVMSISSDHRKHIIVLSTTGDVLLGDFSAAPTWTTLLSGDYVAAGLW